jgi:hypothetical protein
MDDEPPIHEQDWWLFSAVAIGLAGVLVGVGITLLVLWLS